MSSCVSRQPLPLEAAEKATTKKQNPPSSLPYRRWALIPPPSPQVPSLGWQLTCLPTDKSLRVSLPLLFASGFP